MPHTQSRYQQDLEFNDARVFIGPGDIAFFSSAGSAPITRNAAGDWSFNIAVSTTGFLGCNLSQAILRRTGFFEDTQNFYGGAGIPASAQAQNYRPDVLGAMSATQQLQPRTALKVKGYRLLSFDAIYVVTGAAFGTLQSRLDLTKQVTGVANSITNIIPVANNGLTNVVSANPYVINLALTTAQLQAISNPAGGSPGYVTLVDESLWLELDVVTGASASGKFYGFDVTIGYNFN